jgi:hypothetical protein
MAVVASHVILLVNTDVPEGILFGRLMTSQTNRCPLDSGHVLSEGPDAPHSLSTTFVYVFRTRPMAGLTPMGVHGRTFDSFLEVRAFSHRLISHLMTSKTGVGSLEALGLFGLCFYGKTKRQREHPEP